MELEVAHTKARRRSYKVRLLMELDGYRWKVTRRLRVNQDFKMGDGLRGLAAGVVFDQLGVRFQNASGSKYYKMECWVLRPAREVVPDGHHPELLARFLVKGYLYRNGDWARTPRGAVLGCCPAPVGLAQVREVRSGVFQYLCRCNKVVEVSQGTLLLWRHFQLA